MFTDVCIPNNNEEDFIKVAEALGTQGVLFLYEKKEKDLNELRKKTKLKLFSGIISLKGNSNAKVVFAKGEQNNVENKQMRFLYGFETLEQKDSLHYRRSGINQVVAASMKQKEKVLVLDMEKILRSREPEQMLGRMQLNLELARKYKLNLIICSFATVPENLRAQEEYAALIRTLGFQEEAKKAVNFLNEYLNYL
jgi:RNase P/RNase MRP subunit p30